MGQTDAVIYLMGPSALDRQAYRLLLREELHLGVTVESDFAPVAVWAAMRARPDLALVTADRASPEVRDAIQMIPRLRKQTRILVASSSVDDTVLKDWGRCGIDGYVVKDGGVEELRPAVSAVLMGKGYFSAGVREAIERGRTASNGSLTLSPRENELLPLLAQGLTLREAASRMTVSYKTADSYRTSLLRKLGVRDRVELARYAIREGIIDPQHARRQKTRRQAAALAGNGGWPLVVCLSSYRQQTAAARSASWAVTALPPEPARATRSPARLPRRPMATAPGPAGRSAKRVRP